MNNIICKNINFKYIGDDKPALSGLSCVIKGGAINLLLGPSGCGKSTFLYLLSGLIPHTIEGDLSGSISLNGREFQGLGQKQLAKDISLVFQDPESQFFTFTVEDELAFALENLCLPPEEIKLRIEEALNLVGLEGYEEKRLDQLSGGQKQKIAIAIALSMNTKAIILDEPTANLDPQSTKEVFALIHKLCQEQGKTIIIVEHKLDTLLPLVDRLLVMDDLGQIVLEGEPKEVLSRLAFGREYTNIPIFLPELLLIIRNHFLSGRDCPHMFNLGADFFNQYANSTAPSLADIEEQEKILSRLFCSVPVLPSKEPLESNNPLLELKEVGFSYDKAQPVIKDISFNIYPGDFCAILGRNGIGKSTLLNLIFGVLDKNKGQILWNGKPIDKIKKAQLYRSMGLVFQNPEWQFVTNKVCDELAYSLKGLKITNEEKNQRITAALETFHLEKEREQSPYLLSQGQKRRLSVAAMLLAGQEILFLDEPTYGQDYDNQLELMELMSALNSQGITIVIITHDLSLVADYAKRVLVLDSGTISYDGSPNRYLAANPGFEPPSFGFCRRMKQVDKNWPQAIGRKELEMALKSQLTQGVANNV